MKTSTSFEYTIRKESLHVECYGLSDEHGIYKTVITGAYLDDVDVLGLLTDTDMGELSIAADKALIEQALEDQYFRDYK